MFAQQLLNGLVLGSIYALFALGFTLTFGVLGVVNLVYGVYFTSGAFLALFVSGDLHVAIAPAIVVASIATGLAAVVVDGVLLGPLRRAKAPELASLMATLGATLAIYSVASAALGADIRRFDPGVLGQAAFDFLGVRMTLVQIAIIAAAGVVVAGLLLLLKRTRLGTAIRALAEDEEAAQLMGVRTNVVAATVSFLSGALGAVAGALIGLNYDAVEPYMGESMMLRGFAAIVLGGVGDVRGALAAGLILGLLETFTAGYVASSYKDAVSFALLVVTLWIRPTGLFGRSAAGRA
jgi:branched-chain amino acid transport system permease protein